MPTTKYIYICEFMSLMHHEGGLSCTVTVPYQEHTLDSIPVLEDTQLCHRQKRLQTRSEEGSLL